LNAIAIDGPAGAGKSTAARRLAERLGAYYVDTGAMYRALTLKALERGVPVDDEAALVALLGETVVAFGGPNAEGVPTVLLDERDVTQEIRSPRVSGSVSAVARHPGVRAELVRRQRQLALHYLSAGRMVVMDGRDIGTVVLPEARVKVFLTASLDERARRRHEELARRGERPTYGETLERLRERDRKDAEREVAPLRKAEDAVEIDTTGKSVDEVVEAIVRLVEERLFNSVQGRKEEFR